MHFFFDQRSALFGHDIGSSHAGLGVHRPAADWPVGCFSYPPACFSVQTSPPPLSLSSHCLSLSPLSESGQVPPRSHPLTTFDEGGVHLLELYKHSTSSHRPARGSVCRVQSLEDSRPAESTRCPARHLVSSASVHASISYLQL